MLGLMQDWPLLVHKIIDHAALYHGDREVVTRSVEGPIHRTNYREIRRRSRRVASALERLGLRPGDRIATLGTNTWRHLESWYGIAGMGGIYHTLNPRLFPDQLVYIANHAEDRALFFDICFAPLIAAIAPRLETVRHYIALSDRVPEGLPASVLAYEDFVAGGDESYEWKSLDENTACGLCYTSGTTGEPKGVLYSHRSNVLHSFITCQADCFGPQSRDTILPIVPMFHANSWGIAFSAPMVGAKLVLPGAKLDGASLCELFDTEKVTGTAAVPTVWLAMLAYLEQTGKVLPYLKRVVIGGAACPRRVIETFENKYGVEVSHSWGMTEMSPVGTIGSLTAAVEALGDEEKMAHKLKQGRPMFGVEMKIVDDANCELPRDGEAFGRLKVRGPAVAKSYFRGEGCAAFDADGWFDTGDIGTLDAAGYMTITDRAKDVIKSGGEWISSIAIENIAICHPALAETAVIGIPDDRWGERPLLIAVLKPGETATRDAILQYLEGRIARWWMPEDVIFVEEIPHTATGKIQKTTLRERYGRYRANNP
ncbi:MAG TPA: long-chain-fatty-acid--CoA ligase [Rhizomicrobium sp.]|jgi:fatty-acyl-CoA synthase|nr:long-chain-fatty-acid--CoA ligase [Rhizomicrobium sp.]